MAVSQLSLSSAEAEEKYLFDNAHGAAENYATYTLAQVDRIVRAVVQVCEQQCQYYAEWAVKETGFGDVATKAIKNQYNLKVADQDLGEYISPQIDHKQKIVSFPKPAGVIVGLVPCTNPVATVFFKVLSALMTRNAIILCPHPAAKACCKHAAELMAEIAEREGAPSGLIQCVAEPSIELTGQLMRSERCSLILATGGPAMVRAAYSSSNPAIGVGPGNVGCYVHESAKIQQTAKAIVASVSFDNSLPCTTESVVIADRVIADELIEELERAGTYFVNDSQELSRVRQFLFSDNHLNPKAIGKSAQWIAEQCGIAIPESTKVLAIEIYTIGSNEPVSAEKMFPVLGLMRVDGGVQAGIRSVRAMLEITGKGHSAVIHAQDPLVVARYGEALPVCRVSVNVSGVTGSSGFQTNLLTGAVIGTGFFGRSSVSENIGPKHLIQWTRVAYNNDPSEVMGDMDGAVETLLMELRHRGSASSSDAPNLSLKDTDQDELRGMIRDVLKTELRSLLGEKQ